MGKSNSIQIQFKVELNEGMVRSISFIQTVQVYEKGIFFDVFLIYKKSNISK